MSKSSHLIMGARISYDQADDKVFITMDDAANVIESEVVEVEELDWEIPRDVKYDVLFTGQVVLYIHRLPCYIVNPVKLDKQIDGKHQIELFNQQNSEESTVRGKYKFFNTETYETHRAAGTKYRPDTSLSKKNQKKFHAERRGFEAEKGYSPMYPSEQDKKAAATADVKTETVEKETKSDDTVADETADETEKVQKEKDDKGEIGTKVDAKVGDTTSAGKILKDGAKEEKTEKEETVDIAKEMDDKKSGTTAESLNLDIGKTNIFTIFSEVWDGFVIAYHHKSDNLYTIAATKESSVNNKKYYLVFPKEATATFVKARLEEHGDLADQIANSEIYKLSDILQDDLKGIPCVAVLDGQQYCNSI